MYRNKKPGFVIRSYEQLVDWMNGISKHNKIDDECCPDFTCCAHIMPDDLNAKRLVYEHFMEHNYELIRQYKIDKLLE